MVTLVVFGDISIDIPVRVDHLPGPDEKLWASPLGDFPGGMGANTAAAFATLGGRATLIAGVGSDARGRACLADLERRGVDVTSVAKVRGPTFWTLAVLDKSGEKALLMFETRSLTVPWEMTNYDLLGSVDAAHFIAEAGSKMLEVMRFCRSRGVTTSVDIEETALEGADLPQIVALADIVFCGGRKVLTELGSRQDPVAASRKILSRGPTIVVTTLGKDGCLVSTRRVADLRIPGITVEVVDTTGAGDCFAGAFLYGHTSGWPHRASAELANLMAGMSVTTYGSRGRLLGLQELGELPEARGLRFAAR